MSMTPGPWIVEKTEELDIFYSVKGSTGFYVTNVCNDCSDTESEANARAIAALPDLLAAAEALLEDPDNDRNWDELRAACRLARSEQTRETA